MEKLSRLKNKYGLLLLLGVFFLILVTSIALIFLRQTGGEPEEITGFPSPTPIQITRQQKFSELQQAQIGDERKAVERLTTIEKEESLPDGSTRYTLRSPLLSRKNEIRVRNEQVIFERILIPESRKSPGYVTISEYRQRFGVPEAVIKGSKFYGPHLVTYLYPKQGLAFIGNPITDEIYEVQTFPSMSVASYREAFGEDIAETMTVPM